MLKKLINLLAKKIKLSLKKIMWSCKSTIAILKSDKTPAALRVIKMLATVLKLAGITMSCLGAKDFIGVSKHSKELQSAVGTVYQSAMSGEIKGLSEHHKDIMRFIAVMKSLCGILVTSAGRLIDVFNNYKAHKLGIVEMQNPFTGEPIKEGFGMSKRDHRTFARRHRDSMIEAIAFAFSIVIKLITKAIKGILVLINKIRTYGYSKDIERMIRSGEISERSLIKRCKEIAINYLTPRLSDANNELDRSLIKDSIRKIKSARTFEDFSFLRSEPFYGKFEVAFTAYRMAVKRLEKEIDLSRTVSRV
jgi:hypothetical protein